MIKTGRTWLRLVALVLTVGTSLAGCQNTDQTRVRSRPVPVQELTSLAADSAAAVWKVETEGCDWRGTGSAFAIDARHLITNQHVIANDSSPRLLSHTGAVRTGRVIGALERPDVAVIEVDEDLPAVLAWAATSDLERTEPLVVMGYPIPDRTFALTVGEIVSFQPKGTREALLSNAPIDRGNSGGPAVRRDGTVAGLITQMATNSGGARVAIAFTAESVRRAADGFLRAPNRDFPSTCGRGPDYVPPVPGDFELPQPQAVPPPPSQPDTAGPSAAPNSDAPTDATPTLAPGTAPPERAPEPTRACPRGTVSITLDPLNTSPAPDNPGWWMVSFSGRIDNATRAGIVLDERIAVTIEGDPPRDAIGFPDVTALSPGSSTAWRGGDSTYSPNQRPVRATAKLNWRWADSAYGHCPSDAVTAETSAPPS